MAKDDDEFDTEVGADGATEQVDEQDDDEAEVEEETVESLRERLARADAALKKANKEAERHRKRAKVTAEEADEPPTATEERSHERAVRAAARASLREAGFTGSAERAKRLLRLIDVREVEFDDDDDPLGLEDQIDELKEDFPELFRVAEEPSVAQAQRVRTGRVDASAGAGRRSAAAKSASDRIAEGLRGGRGR